MSESHVRSDDDGGRPEAATAFTRADLACAFGPSFFLVHLGRFVRDHCPDSTENLPAVELRLSGGETLVLCHVIGVSPHWVMLAVRDSRSHGAGMAIELVPYELICSVCIRTPEAGGVSIGFAQTQAPEIIAPETLLRDAMAPHLTANVDPGALPFPPA
jgi:hypothetical protein